MSKVRLTKNELKKQKEDRRRFERYLPMLQLRKKQLQLEILKVYRAINQIAEELNNLRSRISDWVDVFAEEIPLSEFISLKSIKTEKGNVAGIDLPLFLEAVFEEKDYDLILTPFWVDTALEATKETLILKAKLAVKRKQTDILKEELRIATQRVNLFEKVKIPESKENIRVIQIYLGELQTAGVVRGKIAKAKLEKRKSIGLS